MKLAARWSKRRLERAASIVNDIAEGIDNGESRAELRQALAIYADLLCDEQNAMACKRSEIILDELKKFRDQLKEFK